MEKLKLDKAPLRVSELIRDLESIKEDSGDVEVWMLSSGSSTEVNDKIELESVSTVSMFMTTSSDTKGVMLISGKEYLKIS